MSAPTFTPGPWKLETESRSEDGSDLLVTTPDGAWNIADCRDHSGLGVDSIEQAEANARLIAAAPELLAFLKRTLCCPDDCVSPEHIEAKRLIAKVSS